MLWLMGSSCAPKGCSLEIGQCERRIFDGYQWIAKLLFESPLGAYTSIMP
jgi:hypothetical protein